MGIELPLPTAIVVGFEQFRQPVLWVLFVFIIIVVVAIKYIRKDPKGRYMFDKFLLNLPVLGQVLRKIAVARFHPYPWHPDYLRRAHSGRFGHYPQELQATPF